MSKHLGKTTVKMKTTTKKTLPVDVGCLTPIYVDGMLWFMPGAHNPERATPILGLCHGVFTDRFIFRHILGQFSRENGTFSTSMNAA